MKNILCLTLLILSINSYAASSDNMNGMSGMNMDSMMNHSTMMYLDFGLGIVGAGGWDQASWAINAMTMGISLNKNLGVEVGMDALPNGANSAGQAMIMSYHMAAKGILPLSDSYSLYGKAGLGVNTYSGSEISNNSMSMGGMANLVSMGLYYAGGMQFNFNKNFAIYVEGSGIAAAPMGNNSSTNTGWSGSSYMGTIGLEVRI